MRVLLIQPPWYGFQGLSNPRVHLGVAYVAAVLERDGREVSILNGETYFEPIAFRREGVVIDEESYVANLSPEHPVFAAIVDEVVGSAPDVIGISMMTANSTAGYILARRLKEELPSTTLIAGGVHPTLLPEEPLTDGGFDVVVRGEGEHTVADLVDALEAGRSLDDVLGIMFVRDGEIVSTPPRPLIEDLDSLPLPAFHLVKGLDDVPTAANGITTSRGCPFRCNYCASQLMWTRSVRFRSPQAVVDEIRHRHETLGTVDFAFNDDTFTLKRQFVEEFCRGIIDSGLAITWRCDTRGDTLDPDLLRLMRKAGCRQLLLGLESGSPRIQKAMKKNIDTDKVAAAIRMSRRAGIETTVYFMVGFPEETEADVEQSLAAMKRLKPDHTIWSILTPYPGTEVWDVAFERGLVSCDADWSRYFHHFSRGSVFETIPQPAWDRLLERIEEAQTRLERRTKVRQAVRLAVSDPGELLRKVARRMPGSRR